MARLPVVAAEMAPAWRFNPCQTEADRTKRIAQLQSLAPGSGATADPRKERFDTALCHGHDTTTIATRPPPNPEEVTLNS